jgi:hypothetical protein
MVGEKEVSVTGGQGLIDGYIPRTGWPAVFLQYDVFDVPVSQVVLKGTGIIHDVNVVHQGGLGGYAIQKTAEAGQIPLGAEITRDDEAVHCCVNC